MPAPSPITNPSLSLSHGLDAVFGSSFLELNAFAEQKPATVRGVIAASAPPATITSASPYSIIRLASPIECVPEVQAVTIDIFGPLRPNAIERLPATMLIMVPGTKNGEIFLGPPVLKSST